MAQALSLNVSNSVGGSNRAPILVANEYHHWSQRMQRYLMRLGSDVWRSVKEGTHVHVLTPVQTCDNPKFPFVQSLKSSTSIKS